MKKGRETVWQQMFETQQGEKQGVEGLKVG